MTGTPSCQPDADGFCPAHGWDCADYQLHLDQQEGPVKTRPFRVIEFDTGRCWRTFSTTGRALEAIDQAQWKPGIFKIVDTRTAEVVQDFFDAD